MEISLILLSRQMFSGSIRVIMHAQPLIELRLWAEHVEISSRNVESQLHLSSVPQTNTGKQVKYTKA